MLRKITDWIDYIRLAFMLLVTTLRWLKTRGRDPEELRAGYYADLTSHAAGRHARRVQSELGHLEAHAYMRDRYGISYDKWLESQTDEIQALATDPVALARRLARATTPPPRRPQS